MAQRENTLGAPTEGLGQTVTFAFDSRTGIPSLNVPGEQRARLGVNTGRTPGVEQAAPLIERPDTRPPQSAAVDLILKAGDAVLNKKLEKARIEQFVGGMQRAMAGEAVSDIAQEQPWYATLFGDAAVVDGARQYAQHANVLNAVGKLEEAMPELRKMPAGEASKFMSQAVQDSMTGDKATDMAILRSYSSAMPQFMRRQAKEHYAWKQEEAVTAQSSALAAAASRLNREAGAYAMGFSNDEQYGQLKDEVLALSRKADGQDEKAWQGMLGRSLQGMAKRGELHALKAFREAGVVGVLPPEMGTAFEAALHKAEAATIPAMTAKYAMEMAEIKTAASIGGVTTGLAERIDALNAAAVKEFGVGQGPFSPDEKVALLSGSMTAVYRAEEAERMRRLTRAEQLSDKLGDAAKKEAKDAELRGMVQTSLVSGTGMARLKAVPGMTEDIIEREVINAYQGAKPGQQRATVLYQAMTAGMPASQHLRNELQGRVSAAVTDKGMDWGTLEPVYNEWKAMHDMNPVLADNYFGKMNGQLAYFNRMLTSTGSQAAAAKAAFADRPPKGSIDKPTVKSAAEAVNAAHNPGLPSWVLGLRRMPLATGQDDVIVQMVGRDIEDLSGMYGNLEEASKVAVNRAMRDGRFETMGGYVISSDPKFKPLGLFLTDPGAYSGNKNDERIPFGQGSDTLDDIVGQVIDNKLHGPGGVIPPTGLLAQRASAVRVFRMPDENGEPVLHISAVAGGEMYTTLVRGKDLFDAKAAAEGEKKARAAGRRGGTATEQRNIFVPPGQ